MEMQCRVSGDMELPAKRGRYQNDSTQQVYECDSKPIGRVQPGLLAAKPKHGAFVTVRYLQGADHHRQEIMELIRRLQQYGNAAGERTWSVVTFNPELWKNWQNGQIRLEKRPEGNYLLPNSTKFVNTGGDIFFFLKSDSMDHIGRLKDMVSQQLNAFQDVSFDVQDSETGNNRVIGGLFADGLANPTDVENIDDFVITTEVDKGATGGSYMLTQKFVFNWTILDNMTRDQLENMIGRTVTDDVLVVNDPRRHTKCAHILDENGKHPLIFRQSMPYGLNKTGIGREEGTFYISCANTCQRFLDILKKLVAEEDHLISTVHAEEGSLWYVPSADELGLAPVPVREQLTLMPQWDVKSDNGYMFYNSREYMYRMTTGGYHDNTPSSRVLKLMGRVLTDWQRSWFEKTDEPLIPDLQNFLNNEDRTLLAKYDNAVPIRKGLATYYTLQHVVKTPPFSEKFDLYRIYPDELIVGVMPSFAFGLGKRVMPYLTPEEQIPAFQMGVNEGAAIGHVVPDYQVILDKGLQAIIDEMENNARSAQTKDKQMFFLSAAKSLMGVKAYIESYAVLADNLSTKETFTEEQKANLRQVRDRMRKLAKNKPKTFLEAAQLVFAMHCCLHIVGELISIGRLDLLLGPFYAQGQTTMEEAQEIIDCFFMKIGERTLLNRHAAQDKIFPGMCAVPYTSGGNFPQGGCMNQWGQQLTIGGYLPNDEQVPTSACNAVTLMCLRASRRLPLNAPCLTLRLHRGISQEVLEETAKTLLSGGAHPVLLHDDRLVPALQESGRRGIHVRLRDARNYACDGCFEPVFVGASEFAFCTFPLLDAVEMALNEGTLYSQAGPTFLRGSKKSFPSPHANQIKTFKQFQDIFLQHLRLHIPLLVSFLAGGYGNIVKVCPSPLLSVMMRGCIEAGRDHSGGGTEYHDLGFMFVGGSNAIDSLYAIKKLVYDPLTALTTLPDLLTCLKCDWGYNMKEFLIDVRAGTGRGEAQASFFKHLRDAAMSLPKFGHGEDAELKELASWMFENVFKILRETFENAPIGVKEIFERLEKEFSLPDRPFGFVALTGIGTFEAYVGYGLNNGASADGRRSGQPIASDLSPAPVPQDLPASPDSCNIYKALECWNLDVINIGMSCGSEVDLMIREDFPLDKLADFLRHYSDLDVPIGSNVIAITCANPETLEKASKKTDPYELVRVRQGGWTEFFITLFPVHQGQQRRRMYVKP
ncbi:(2S)-3-sulfopropanediol dehydratase-like [Branchiostoma lanceolatum]|uniref:(2S)-3-sulfopropanediol dehydratase-like n=1 Tax=Branchiostoma lanceolatum TaxID=7740 RepID=UPI003451C6E4